MLKLDTQVNLNLNEFFRWWGGELRALIPERFRHLLVTAQNYLVLTRADDRVRLSWYSATDGASDLDALTLDESGKRQLEQLLAERPALEEAELILQLAPEQALRKELVLPAAAQENLQQVTGFEMDRQTPFKSDQVYYQARVLEKITATNQIRVELILIPRIKLDEMLAELNVLGLYPDAVDVMGSDPPGMQYRPRYNLLPASLRPKGANWPQLMNAGLALLLLLLLAAVVALPILRDRAYLRELQDEVGAVSQVAMKVEALKKDADQLLQETRFLIDKKKREPVLVDMLNELTVRIPDQTWLSNLRFHDRRLQIQGNSPSASSMIETIEASPLFQNTRFVSPVTQDTRTKMERFQIETEVTARPDDDSAPD